MRSGRWIALPVAAVVAASALASSAAGARPQAHAARLPVLATGSLRSVVRPHSISYTGDGTGIVGRLPGDLRAVGRRPGFLHWTAWTRTHANAFGTLWGKSCIPDCAGSPFSRQPVHVTAFRARRGHFTRLTLYYTYRGRPVVDRRCIRGQIYGLVIDGRCE
jgi:hypothetical protein